MKIRFGLARGFLPYVQTRSSDGWGHARGPWVTVPEKSWHDMVLRRHEEWHVAQWYALMAIIVVVGAAGRFAIEHFGVDIPPFTAFAVAAIIVAFVVSSDSFTRRKEAAAYGESLRARSEEGRAMDRPARRYAAILANSDVYDLHDPNTDEALRLILKRFEDGRLF